MIYVVASVRVRPGKRDTYLGEMRKILETVRAEDGCIDYTIVQDIDVGHPAQRMSPEDTVTILERWEDEAALKAHATAAHMVKMRERTAAAVEKVDLQVFRPDSFADSLNS